MPLYEYACDGCHQNVTLLQPMSVHAPETICPQCGGKNLRRLFSTFSSNASKSVDAPAPSGAGHCHSGGCGCA